MIDQSAFKVEWSLLCERFGRKYSRVMAIRYYESLSPRMTTEQFQSAARALFDESEFFPKPEDFIGHIREPIGHQALDQWQLCHRAMRGDDVLDRMSDAGRKTVRLMGGIQRLRQGSVDELHFRRAEFLRLYESAHEIEARENQALPPWTSQDTQALRKAAPNLKLLGGSE